MLLDGGGANIEVHIYQLNNFTKGTTLMSRIVFSTTEIHLLSLDRI